MSVGAYLPGRPFPYKRGLPVLHEAGPAISVCTSQRAVCRPGAQEGICEIYEGDRIVGVAVIYWVCILAYVGTLHISMLAARF